MMNIKTKILILKQRKLRMIRKKNNNNIKKMFMLNQIKMTHKKNNNHKSKTF